MNPYLGGGKLIQESSLEEDNNAIQFACSGDFDRMVNEFHKPAGLPASGRIQFDHVSFNLENEEALLELKAKLEDHGVEVTEIIDHKIIHSIYFNDPNGIALEASFWVHDPTRRNLNYSDPTFFTDPDPVPSAREKMKAG